MKKLFSVMALFLLLGLCSMNVSAADTKDMVVALGADLTEEQRAGVLSLMELTEADLAECTVIYITNDMEHEYLDAYLDASLIGTKSLSSVKITKKAPGSGILVTTRNINYCTTGMYRNALMTAGMEDTDVLVVAPTPISGTAGLIGALKAYGVMADKEVSDTALDAALDELITTGELAQNLQGEVGSDEAEALIAWLKGKIASGELDIGDEESVRAAIAEGETNFGITLSEEDKLKIIGLLQKLDSLGLNAEYLIEQAQSLYEKYGLGIVENANEAINEAVGNALTSAIKGFFENLVNSITDFFKNLFS
ncbi:MAG: DUF1002 domain-containing protein [Roseburia sp.]|nr:DUF1002 domain-containing protein [Ruminococcus sp.]MCM1155427.1 DUF1002 domain-containing protein [Roseburia sp.]MCM1243700.1 DUF1002 domain-containing protein [Roseburia sp.]